MNNKEFAKKLNISEPTLYNWKKEKPFLYEIIMNYKENFLDTKENLNNLSLNEQEILKYFKKLSDLEQEYFLSKIKIKVLEKELK